jgi:Cu-Zn family superoxide dismutase
MEDLMKTALAALTCAMLIGATPALAQDADLDLAAAEATFIDADGNELGTATLSQTEQGLEIAGVIEGLPEGEHGFHIHETGECDPADGFESAGGHFAPNGNEHGFDNPDGPHAGDMRNQTVAADGKLVLDVTNDLVSLTEGEEAYLLDDDGSALIIHANADDYQTDPGGNSGDRIACAVVADAQP